MYKKLFFNYVLFLIFISSVSVNSFRLVQEKEKTVKPKLSKDVSDVVNKPVNIKKNIEIVERSDSLAKKRLELEEKIKLKLASRAEVITPSFKLTNTTKERSNDIKKVQILKNATQKQEKIKSVVIDKVSEIVKNKNVTGK